MSEIYDQVTSELEGETDDGLFKIAATHYNLDVNCFSREQLIDRIASIEVEAYLK